METNDVRHALDRRCARKPLDADAIRADVVRPAGLWRTVEVVARTGSTNADLLARAQRAEGAEGFVLAAEEQTSGRGRMGRSWVSPPRAALTFSVLLRPQAPAARLGWLPLLAGVAVATALREATGVTAVLKWPNDLLAGGAKLGGILAEAAPASGTGGTAVVVGIGINVDTEPDELPPPGPGPGGALAATSLRIAAAARPESSAPFVATAGGRSCSQGSCWRSSGGMRPGSEPTAIPKAAGCTRSTPGCAPRSAARSRWNCPAVRRPVARPPGSIPTAGCWSGSPRPARCGHSRQAMWCTSAEQVRAARRPRPPALDPGTVPPDGNLPLVMQWDSFCFSSGGLTMCGMEHGGSLADGEEQVLLLRPHWKTLVWPVLLAVVVVALALIALVLIPAGSAATVERLAVAVIAIAVLMVWLRSAAAVADDDLRADHPPDAHPPGGRRPRARP